MLRLLQEAEFDRCMDFAYELALDPARSGYHVYYDGMKTREDFVSRARKALKRPGEDIRLFVAEFLDYCRERWPGFTLDLGFPAENVEATGWLDGQGIPCNERSWNFLLNLDGYQPLPEPSGVKRITAENFEEFAAIHRQIQGDMFWNCERVRAALDRWAIFVTGEGEAAGEVLMTLDGDPHEEIFALEFADRQSHQGAFRVLLAAALNCLNSNSTKWLTFFVDEDCPEGEILKDLGFRLVGTFVCHRTVV